MTYSDFSSNNPVRPERDVNLMNDDEYRSYITNKILWEIRNEYKSFQAKYGMQLKAAQDILFQLKPGENTKNDILNTELSKESRRAHESLLEKEKRLKEKLRQLDIELNEIKSRGDFWERESRNITVPPPRHGFWSLLWTTLCAAGSLYFMLFNVACFFLACKLEDCFIAEVVAFLVTGCDAYNCGIIPTTALPLNTIIFYFVLAIVGTIIYYKNSERGPQRIP